MSKQINQHSEQMPPQFTGAAAWVTKDLSEHPTSWLTQLSQQHIDELINAANSYLAMGADIGVMQANQFALPTLGPYLESLKNKLLHGNGLEVIRGLDAQSLSLPQKACIFCGIGAHIGSARSQNADGHILGHVKDMGKSSDDPNTRIYQTAERQSFHTDSADVVGLMCLKDAKSGGDSLLVSALSIYNRMQSQRPDLLSVLFDPIATDRRGEVPIGAKPYLLIPVFNWHEGYLSVFYQRQYIESAQRFDDAPQLSDLQIEALDMFDELANDPTLHFEMRLEPGDMQFVYNHSQLHDRTGFVDWPEVQNRRHMLRLWLSMDGDRPLPECFKERYGSIEIGQRGGIITEHTKLHAPLSVDLHG